MKYIKLKNSLNDDHKQPVSARWQAGCSLVEALKHVQLNKGGVGVLVEAPLAVLDIDGTSIAVDALLEQAIAEKCLIIKSLKGYHIYFRRRPEHPQKDARYVVDGVSVEYYCGSSTRQIVLPVEGTPRYELGSRIIYALGDDYYGSHALDTIDELLRKTLEQSQFSWSALLEPQSSVPPINTTHEHELGRFRALFGVRWRSATAEEICSKMRLAAKGTRHNLLLTLSILWEVLGYENNEDTAGKLLEAAKYAWRDEWSEATEREIQHIWNGRLRFAEAIKTQEQIRQQTRARSKDEKKIESLYERIFGNDELYWYDDGLTIYILHDRYAIAKEQLRAYAAARNVALSDSYAELLVVYIQSIKQFRDAIILKSYPVVVDDRIYLAARIGSEVGVIVKQSDEISFTTERIDNIYLLYTNKYRDFSDCWDDDLDDIVKYYIDVCNALFSNNHAVAIAALLANVVCGTARCGVLITGAAGSGKSTVNLLLQYIAQSDGRFVGANDRRDLMSALVNSRIIGIDESETLSEEIQEVLKTAISYGTFAARRLYTNATVDIMRTDASVVLSSVEINKLSADLLRRCVVIEMQQRRNRASENALLKAIQATANKLMLACLAIASIDRTSADKDLLHVLTNGTTTLQELPAWLRDVSKIDIANTYWHTCCMLGVDEATARKAWQQMRGAAHQMGLGLWQDVIELYDNDSKFAMLLQAEASAKEIVQYLLGDLDDTRKHASSLQRNAAKAAALLQELGYTLTWRSVRARGSTTRFYRLEKLM